MSHRNRRGANAMEFALLAPIFWLLLAAMCDLGWLFYHQSMLDTATTAGCRAGSLVDPGWNESNIGAMRAKAETVMVQYLGQTPGTSCAQDDESCSLKVDLFGDPPGRSMLCEVQRDFDPLLGVAMDSARLKSAIVVRMEWQRWPQ